MFQIKMKPEGII